MKASGTSGINPRWRAALARLALGLTLAWGLGGCLEADTLGGDPPDEVAVGDPPTWDNGIGTLMTLKCGVCHQVPPPQHAPRSLENYRFDFTLHSAQPGSGVTGVADALTEIRQVVGFGTMPLEFATPLTDQEREAILAWDGS